ncbi:hypothetical protein [Cellulomonas taurus]|uniref:hypothetical protein n=1 Tax=Cellulomonas taurus TaxID=2729175 RepID=UPI001980D5C2|nr:hypothetical protein [Cellulomonas taurus]
MPATRGAWERHQPAPVLVEDLASLRGPVSGVVRLPRHLEWSERREYDLGVEGDVIWLYSRVIREASSEQDLQEHLDLGTLLRLWPDLRLPDRHRRAWEAAFAELHGR